MTTPIIDTDKSRRKHFSTVTKYLKKYRAYLIVGGIVTILSNALALIIPLLTKAIFDLLQAKGSLDKLLNYVLIMFGLALLSGFFRFMMRRTIIWMSRHVEYDLRQELFSHLLALSPSFYHRTRTGDIMARLTNDLEAVRQVVGPGIMYIANAVVNLVIGLSLMVYLSPKLTLLAAVPLVLMPLSVNRVANLMHRRAMKVQEHFGNLSVAAQENLAGIRVVRAYCQEEKEIDGFSLLSKTYITLNMDLAKLESLFFPLMRFVAGLSALAVFFFGGLEVIRGNITLGAMVAFFAYLAILLWPVIALGWVLSLYQRGDASLERINRILFTQPEIRNETSGTYRAAMRGDVELRNLRFKYNGAYVLDGVSLKIDAGRTVGIVGTTGSGKTTLVSLLARLYPAPPGEILIDGVDINKWDLETLRRQIGFATQEPFLFSDTIFENIRFGRPQADRATVQKAAETAAFAKDVADFRDGLDTMVGERGITLSGGQKQRAAIARAIIVDPGILILDDTTSAVDTETEDQINERIKSVLRGRTSIVISHRVSAVKEADVIVYLQDGRILEQGNHDELMRLGGAYAELYRMQLLAQELEQL